MSKGFFAKQVVYKELDRRLELGGPTELQAIERLSKYKIEDFILYFRLNLAHLCFTSVKDSTINRYVEQWLEYKLSGNKA